MMIEVKKNHHLGKEVYFVYVDGKILNDKRGCARMWKSEKAARKSIIKKAPFRGLFLF